MTPARRSSRIAAVLVLLATGALSVPAGAGARPLSAGRQHKQATAVGTGGAVASAEFHASKAGIEVLRAGGNAVDAAVAVASTLGVTEPFVAGPGGGGFMVIHLARSHKTITIDGREMCPARCNPHYFVNPKTGKPYAFEVARRSGLSVGVPGTVAQWARAVRRYGKLSLARDLRPAIRVAERGFRIDSDFRQQERESLADLRAFRTSRKLFLRHGKPLPLGSTLRNPDLAQTYRDLAAHGAKYLYRGPLGADIAHTAQHPPVARGYHGFRIRHGYMTRHDVSGYVAKLRPPTHVTYRGLDIYGMRPPSSGGTTVGEALNILSAFPLGSETRARAFFHYLEASRLAFADRNAYIGDTDYVPVPLKGLLDPAYAKTRSCLIKNHALTSPVAPGHPYKPYGGCGSSGQAGTPAHEGTSTNHLVTVDRWGNVVSYTNTIEQLAGSGMTVPGRGFLLNNEMTDFDFAPATPSTYDPNLPAPGKRPRSSMSPTIVLKNGRFDFALGSPGGATIITTVLQMLIEHIDFGKSLPASIAAPRVSQENTTTSYAEPAFYNSKLRKKLQHMFGEKFTKLTGPVLPLDKWIGNATGVQALGGGRLQAAAEPVRLGGGSALVVHPGR
jgi:gamma-glutamyltranspeptidase/glutathione hydrolase